jgi:hypothetical protein
VRNLLILTAATAVLFAVVMTLATLLARLLKNM